MIFKMAQEGDDGYLSVIEGGEEVDSEMISSHTKHAIWQKCLILTLALNLAPPFLELNPDVFSALKTYACANLNTLSIEMMVEYLHNTVIPEMVKKEMNERNCNNLPGLDESICKQIILQRYGLTKLCPGTVYRWLRLLGFNYEAQRKVYYVDGHEKLIQSLTGKFLWRNI